MGEYISFARKSFEDTKRMQAQQKKGKRDADEDAYKGERENYIV